MANQWPSPDFVDGNFAVAQPIGLPVFKSPLPNTTDQLVFRQTFMQALASVTPLALNTAHPSGGMTPDYSSYFLIAEGEKADCGGGIVKWERTYSAVPASYDDWESLVYNYVGLAPTGYSGTSDQAGRLRFTDRVTCRMQYDFFKMGAAVTDPITGASVTPTTPGGIPQIYALAYCEQFTSGGSQFGGFVYRKDYLSDYNMVSTTNAGLLMITTPSSTDYANMILDAAANKWAAGKSFQVLSGTSPVLVDVASLNTSGHTYYKGQIVAEDSTLERWQRTGSIWVRRTKYVLAR